MSNTMYFSAKRLISIDDLSREDIQILYHATMEFKKVFGRPTKKATALKDLTVANLFFEDSTRTRISFELAAKRLGANLVSLSASSSSLKKGESLNDTIQNLMRMKIDLIVMRHKVSGSAHFIHQKTNIPVVNAGDGRNEHPTQALLDLFTLWQKGLKSEDLVITLNGDVLHSRVASSSIKLWNKLGIQYKIVGPRTVMRIYQAPIPLNNVKQKFNIHYNLRIQKERQEKELLPSLTEYNQFFGTRKQDLNREIYYMHPGPINRGVELDSDIADAKNSLILDQVEMGLALRMAVIYLLGQKKRPSGLFDLH